MSQHKSKSRVSDTTMLSGWLFADLLLGLMMIFLVSLTGTELPAEPEPTDEVTVLPITNTPVTNTPTATSISTKIPPSPLPPTLTHTATSMPTLTPTHTSTPTLTPSVTPIPPPPGLDREFVEVVLKADNVEVLLAADSAEKDNERAIIQDQIRAQLGHHIGIRQAGFALIFGTAPSTSNIEEGNRLASEARQLLEETLPEVFINGTTVYEELHYIQDSDYPRGTIRIKGYFLQQGP